MKMKKATAVALAAAVAVGTLGFGVPAKASELVKTTDYTITIPATLNVEGKGWNGTTGITAKLGAGNVFDSEKKLTVTAESENGWKLEAEGVTDTIGYNLAASGNTDSVYSADAPAASWSFTAGEITTEGTKKGMGIVVEDYTDKPAGEYKDTVTFTASVVSAQKTLTLTGQIFNPINASFVKKSLEIEYTDNDTWKDIAERYDEVSLEDNIYGPEGKVVKFWGNDNGGCELKSNESTYTYKLVSINDKVSAYSSYYLQN